MVANKAYFGNSSIVKTVFCQSGVVVENGNVHTYLSQGKCLRQI